MVDDAFFDRFRTMSFDELRKYIDSCLDGFNSKRSDATDPIRTKETFLQLWEILRVKAIEPLVVPEARQDDTLPPLPEAPPPFSPSNPSEHPEQLRRKLKALQLELAQRQRELAQRHKRRSSIKRSIQSLESQIHYLRLEGARHEAKRARREQSRLLQLRMVWRIKRDIERIFMSGIDTPLHKVLWRILPSGEWTFGSILNHYSELQRANPQIHFDIKRLQTVFLLSPSSLYVGLGEFDGYIVLAFSETTKVVLECPIYGNAIYVIREDWQRLAKLPKFELLSQFPDQARRIVHVGDWYSSLREELSFTDA
jgi:hypothetical protein